MGLLKNIIVFTSLSVALFSNHQFEYHLLNNQLEKAMDLYLKELNTTKKHNHTKLKAIAHKLLENGAKSPVIKEKILTIYGLQLTGKTPSLPILETLSSTQHPAVQIACLHLLDHIADDCTAHLYEKGLHSSYLQVRFEAIIHMVMKNDPNAFGALNSIINLIPPHYHPSLVELFAILNSDAARQKLKAFLTSLNPQVRLAALKAISDHNLDEFITDSRKFLTHTDPKLKEAALNFAKKHHDIKARHQINLAVKSPYKHVKIAALLAQKALTGQNISAPLIKMAKEKDLFSIAALEKEQECINVLISLVEDKDRDTRFNAALRLLKHKNTSCKNTIKEILTIDPSYLSIYSHTSPGLTLSCIKTAPLASFDTDNQKNFYKLQTQHFVESILNMSINLDEDTFLEIIKSVFEKRQLHLVPLAIRLLENRPSKRIDKFIKAQANCLAAPLIRSYARLSLYKKDKTYMKKHEFLSLINVLKHINIVDFDENGGLAVNPKTNATQFDLSIQEKSSLYLQALEILIQEHDTDALTCLLKSLRDGNKQNRYIIAGLIIKCLD